jgi:hypothetical protein
MDIAIHDNDMAWNVPLVVEEQLIELGGMRQKESSPMALVLEKAATGGNQHPSHPGGLGVEWDGEPPPYLKGSSSPHGIDHNTGDD